jgi:gas vesicle protein
MLQEYRDVMNGTYRRRATRNTLIGVLAGLLGGAAAGILLAPKAGKETRADIATGVKKGAAKVKEVVEDAAEATKEKFEELKGHKDKGASKEEHAETLKKE